MPVDPAQLSSAIAAAMREYPGSIRRASDVPQVERLSTGSLELDYATGGGYPLGRCVHQWGSYSAGKTLTAYMGIRSAQRHGLVAAYYNIEKTFDEVFARQVGIDTDKLHVVDESTIEGVGTMLETLLGSIHVHVIDSLAAAVSIDELGAKVEDWQIGLSARAWAKVLRRTNERMDSAENLVIMINHARDKFGTGGEAPPGGRMIEHQSAQTIHFKRGGWLFYDNDGILSPGGKKDGSVSGDMEADGYEIQCRVTKNKVGRPLRTARLYWDFAKSEIDHGFELSKAAKWTGVVTETSAGRFEVNGQKIHGMKKLRAAIDADPALQDSIRTALLAMA